MDPQGKKILIIEDEKPMARALELKLTHEGFVVTVAFNGEEASTIMEGNTFDLIICDLVMPKMDGFQVLEHVKSKGLSTPVIILSNLSQEEDSAKVIALGAKEFFIKSDTPISDVVTEAKKFTS